VVSAGSPVRCSQANADLAAEASRCSCDGVSIALWFCGALTAPGEPWWE
jgi:hypothetical protein